MTIATPLALPFPALDRPRRSSRLRPYQLAAGRAIVDSVLNNRGMTFTVVMARQAGKNELSAQVEMLLLIKRTREWIDGVKCAPTREPQALISVNRLWETIDAAGLLSQASPEGEWAVRMGCARMLFLSADGAANVMGHTAGLLLEVDEAQDVDPEKFDREFRPMASTTGATTVYYGTPWDDSTLLARAVERNLELERHDGLRRHFEADWTKVAEFNPAYARFVESERDRLGQNHPLFLTQYALKPVAGGGRLFSGSQRAQMQGCHARQHEPTPGETYVAGLDVGGGAAIPGTEANHDATVLTIARVVEPSPLAVLREPRLEVVEHVAMTGVPHDQMLARVADLLGRVWRVRRLVVDATGMGETVARLLERSLGGGVVQALKFTAETKSKLGWELLAAVNGGRLRMYIADGSTEFAEFWREAEQGRISYRTGRQMNFFVEPSEGHDDYLVSLALVVAAGRAGIAPARIARGRTPLN